VLTGLKKLKVCIAYDTPEGRVSDLPLDLLDSGTISPVYTELEGWAEKLEGVRVLDELPSAARAYIRFLEKETGAPIFLVCVGPRRAETIVLHTPCVGRAAAP
jgi:adenylosuccinate synthase